MKQTNQILDACFHVAQVCDDQMKQKLISELLYQQTVPKSLSLSSDTITREAKRARQLINCAMAMFYTPTFINDENGTHKVVFMSSYSPNVAFKLFDLDPELQKISALASNQSRDTVVKWSTRFYNEARDIVLNPFVYERLSNNKDLMRAVFTMSLYLTGRGQNIPEAQILSTACRSYLKREYKKLKYSQDKDQSVEEEGMALEKIAAISSNIIFTANVYEAISNGLYSEKLLKKCLRRAYKAFDVNFCPYSQVPYFQIKRNGLMQLYAIVKHGINMESLRKYIETSKLFRTTEPWISAEKYMTTFWYFKLFAFDQYALNIGLTKFREGEQLAQVQQMCYNLSKEMAKFISTNVNLGSHSGGRIVPMIDFMITHLTHLSNNVSTREELNSCLHNLTLTSEICSRIYDNHKSDIFVTLGRRADEQVSKLQDIISSLLCEDMDMDTFMDEESSNNTEEDNDTTVELDHYITFIV